MNQELFSFLPIVAVFMIFYFLVMRPQQKKVRLHQELLKNLSKGEKIVLTSGIIGTIHKVIDENEVVVEIAENVRIRCLRSGITAKTA